MKYPVGIPHLMMGFTDEVMPCVHTHLIKASDELAGNSLQSRQQKRMNIPAPQVLKGADSWKLGTAVHLLAYQQPFTFSQQCPATIQSKSRQPLQRLFSKPVITPQLNPDQPKFLDPDQEPTSQE